MPTTVLPQGRLSSMIAGKEATFGVAPSTFFGLNFYTESLTQKTPQEDDPLLGSGLANSRDRTAPAPGLSDHGGDIEVPLDYAQIGYWLALVMGAPTTTGTTDFSHVFTSGGLALPTWAMEVTKKSGDVRKHAGCAAKSLRINTQKKAGYHRATVSIVGKSETLAAAVTPGSQPVPPTLEQIPGTKGIIRVNNVIAGNILESDLTYSTGVSMERYIDDLDAPGGAVLLDQATLDGSLRLRYQSSTIETFGRNFTSVPVELEFTLSATRSLLLSMANVRFDAAGPELKGPGGIEQTLAFKAHQAGEDAMLVATLANGVTSYA